MHRLAAVACVPAQRHQAAHKRTKSDVEFPIAIAHEFRGGNVKVFTCQTAFPAIAASPARNVPASSKVSRIAVNAGVFFLDSEHKRMITGSLRPSRRSGDQAHKVDCSPHCAMKGRKGSYAPALHGVHVLSDAALIEAVQKAPGPQSASVRFAAHCVVVPPALHEPLAPCPTVAHRAQTLLAVAELLFFK